MSNKNHYVAICGPLASGKTTLAQKLSRELGWSSILEDLTLNVYFTDFYKDNRKWAFHTLIAFFIRAIEIQSIIRETLGINSLCQDWYVGEHHGVYSRNTLAQELFDQRDYDICARIDKILMNQSVIPDLIIYLHASPETLLQRVSGRQRDGEAGNLHIRYISSLVKLHEEWVESISIPVLRVNTDHVDFEDKDQMSTIIIDIKKNLNILES